MRKRAFVFFPVLRLMFEFPLVDFSVTRSTFCASQPTFCMLRLTRQFRRQKVADPRIFFHNFEIFKLFGILLYCFPLSRGGGGSRPLSGKFHFFNPSLNNTEIEVHEYVSPLHCS